VSDPAIVWRLLDGAILLAGVLALFASLAALDRRERHQIQDQAATALGGTEWKRHKQS
jgi:hypothetical protein